MRRLIFASALLANGALLAAVSAHPDADRAGQVVLENEKVALTFTPVGGRCISYRMKETGREWIGPHQLGLFVDHWSCYTWPSGLMHLDYTITTEQSADRASVTLSVVVPARGGGKGTANRKTSLEIATPEALVGLKVSKTVTLESGSDVIRVRQAVENPTARNAAPALNVQNHFTPSDGYIWSIPAKEGIIGQAKRPGRFAPSGKLATEEPVDGWLAVGDTVGKGGLLFVFDYNYLERIYSSGSTAEWSLEPVNLPSGQTFETDYLICPFTGMDSLAYANDGLYVGREVTDDARRVRFNFKVAAVDRELPAREMRLTAVSGVTGKVLADTTVRLEKIGRNATPVAFDVPFEGELSPQNNIVVKAKIIGPDGKADAFECNWIGAKSEEMRRYNYGQIGAGAAALAGVTQDNAYEQKPRPKVRRRVAQDFAAIRARAGAADGALVLFGLYTNYLRIHEALAATLGERLRWCNGKPNGIDGFPGTYEELFGNRLVIASNVGAKCLRGFRIEMLADYVREGGTLLVVGGFYTYGHGEFQGTAFEEMSPFAGMKPFEIVEAPEGRPFRLALTGADDPCLVGVSLDGNDEVACLHDLKAKEDSVVLATADGHPAIIARKFGKGRVIGCAMTTMGEAAKPWYDGGWWKTFIRNLAR